MLPLQPRFTAVYYWHAVSFVIYAQFFCFLMLFNGLTHVDVVCGRFAPMHLGLMLQALPSTPEALHATQASVLY
jgi:hypothetical protein